MRALHVALVRIRWLRRGAVHANADCDDAKEGLHTRQVYRVKVRGLLANQADHVR